MDPGALKDRRSPTGALLCRATSKQSGSPCKAPAVRGTELCHIHSGVSLEAAKAKGEANLMLAAAMAATPAMHPGEVLLRAGHAARVLLDRMLAETPADGVPVVGQLERVVEAIDRAARIAKAALDADAADRWVRAQESVGVRDGERVQALIVDVLARLGRSWDEPEVRAAVVAALDELEGGGGS